MAMTVHRCNSVHIAQCSMSRATLEATGSHHWASILPVLPRRTPWYDFGVKNQVVALWNRYSKASIQKAQNGPCTQLIEATSCIERSNAMIKVEELSYFSSYQTVRTDKNWWSYYSPKKIVKKRMDPHRDRAVCLSSSMVFMVKHTPPPGASVEGVGQGHCQRV